jgi:hypothetical protein
MVIAKILSHSLERHHVILANRHDLPATREHEDAPCRTFLEPFLTVIPAIRKFTPAKAGAGIQKSWMSVITGMTELAVAGEMPT